MHSQLFSNKTRGFYPVKCLRYYHSVAALPDDLVRVNDEVYVQFIGAAPANSVPNYNVTTGQMEWLEIPPEPKTQREIQHENQREQKSRLREAALMAFPLQAAVDIGNATAKQTDALKSIKKYTVAVLNTQIDTTDPKWPTMPSYSIDQQ